jgi:hypothetical protein
MAEKLVFQSEDEIPEQLLETAKKKGKKSGDVMSAAGQWTHLTGDALRSAMAMFGTLARESRNLMVNFFGNYALLNDFLRKATDFARDLALRSALTKSPPDQNLDRR